MFKAVDIANYLLIQSPEPVGKLKLQKLLYYAQGLYLALNGEALFQEEILRWKNGPVVRQAWEHFKVHKGNTLELPDNSPHAIDEYTAAFLDKIGEAFNSHNEWHLVALTHDESPWRDTPPNNIISKEAMEAFFEDYIVETTEGIVIAAPRLDSISYNGKKVKFRYIPCIHQGGFVAWVLDKPGCVTSANTLGELPTQVKSALEDWESACA